MNKSIVLFLIFFSFLSFAQDNIYIDFIHHNEIHYDVLEIDVANPDLKILASIEYHKLLGGPWKGLDNINALIKKEAETLNTKEFSVRFVKEYNAALKKTLLEWYNECLRENKDQEKNNCGHYMDYNDLYTAEDLVAYFNVLSLNDHILIGGMYVSFVAARDDYLNESHDLAFQDVHYYDLNKGIEIDPSTILQKKTKRNFIKLAKSKVPDHLQPIADSLDFENGLPLFMGGSFYYFVQGNIEADTDEQIVLQIRLSFEEAIPF